MFPGTDAATENINNLFFKQPMAVVSPDAQVSKFIWKEYTRKYGKLIGIQSNLVYYTGMLCGKSC